MGVNSLSDWTPQEFMNRNNLRIPQTNDDEIQAHEDDGDTHGSPYSTKRFANSTGLKESLDWRNKVKIMRTTILNICKGSILLGQYPI